MIKPKYLTKSHTCLLMLERYYHEHKRIQKKNGTTVYRTSVYLGVDQVTGKKARTTITASTKKGSK